MREGAKINCILRLGEFCYMKLRGYELSLMKFIFRYFLCHKLEPGSIPRGLVFSRLTCPTHSVIFISFSSPLSEPDRKQTRRCARTRRHHRLGPPISIPPNRSISESLSSNLSVGSLDRKDMDEYEEDQ
jgi:hypothetical protein